MNIIKKLNISASVMAALGAAFLFGASTPFAKVLVNNMHPVMLAGLFYLGSGIGLFLIRFIRDRGWQNPGLLPSEWPWLLYAILIGGVLGPVLMMFGLTLTSSSTASLLLNLEAVFTAFIAWIFFRENADNRIVLGMLLIITGGLLLSGQNRHITQQGLLGPLAIAGACLCWAIDNNLTRKVSGADSLFLSASKGIISAIVNIGLGYWLGFVLPAWKITITALIFGFFGYGLSLLLFILALRGLGTARTGAYFSVSPFLGAAIAVVFFREKPSSMFWIAAALMTAGVWLHITEKHEHLHTHELLYHNHGHVKDEHHQHTHDYPTDDTKAHSHPHHHEQITHIHSHYPDIHHRN